MYNENGFIKNVVNDTIELLHDNGVHSFLVKSKQEAKNFILFHVGIETVVVLKNEKEINSLNLEKAILQLGGSIVEEDVKINSNYLKFKNSILKVKVYGNDFILNGINKGDLSIFTDFDEGVRIKTVLVINLQDLNINSLLSVLKKEFISNSTKISGKRQEFSNLRDVSIIFIDENQ